MEIYSPVSHTLFNPADIIRKVSLWSSLLLFYGWDICYMLVWWIWVLFSPVLYYWLLFMLLDVKKEWGKATFELSIISEACWRALMGVVPTFYYTFFTSSGWEYWKLQYFRSSNGWRTWLWRDSTGLEERFLHCSLLLVLFLFIYNKTLLCRMNCLLLEVVKQKPWRG